MVAIFRQSAGYVSIVVPRFEFSNLVKENFLGVVCPSNVRNSLVSVVWVQSLLRGYFQLK